MTGSFNWAQTFYTDPNLVQNAYQVQVSSVKLFFKTRPLITGNKSGIYAPGVEIRICPTLQDVPNLSLTSPAARCEYGAVVPSSSATTASLFTFPTPITILSGAEYAILIKFDGNEDFTLWENVQGDMLLDQNGNITNIVSGGVGGQYIGKLYSFISQTYETIQSVENADLTSASVVPSSSTQSGLPQSPPSQTYLAGSWNAINNTDLKFQVQIARYAHAGFPVQANTLITSNTLVNLTYSDNIVVLSNNVIRLISPCRDMEYVYYDKKLSQTDDLNYGDLVYEYQPYHPGGTPTPATVSVTNGDTVVGTPNNYTLANGTPFGFNQLYALTPDTADEYIVVTSLNHYGAGQNAVNVRKIFHALTNTAFMVDEPFTFTNNAAYFFKSPVGRLISKSRPYISGHTTDLIQLGDSNANSSCRFVNNYVSNISIIAGGSGFNNSDHIVIKGFENVASQVLGGYAASANVVTYANGNIRYVYLSNTGAGFVNTQNMTYSVVNSSGSPSVGTAANITFTVGSVLYTQFGNGNTFFANAKIVNFEAQNLLPSIQINNPAGTAYSLKFKSLYRSAPNTGTFSGKAYYIDPVEAAVEMDVQNNKLYNFTADKHPCIVSRSNQFIIGYANGYIPNTSIIGQRTSNTAVLLVDMYSNNDFVCISMNPQELNTYYAKYNINNDYTNENTNYGNAYAKHITTKINLANGQSAEDLLIYLTAYRPQGTDLKILARLHNSQDGEAFDDKDWTLLEQTDGIGVYSSLTNQTDMVEMSYTMPMYPNSGISVNTSVTPVHSTLNGVVTTSLGSAVITGTGTTFLSSLAVGTLVRLYQPLFANADTMVAVVSAIANDISFTLSDTVSNNSLVAGGMKVDKISFPQQAFKNILNSNVVRYYSSSQVAFDTFDTMQIKMVLLSPDEYIVPKVDDIRVIAVTA